MKFIVCQLCMLLGVQLPQMPVGGGFSPVFNVFGNPASMAALPQPAAGLYTERRFMLRELNVYAMALGVPLPAGVLGVKVWQFGSPLYRQQLAGLGYAMPLGGRLQAGVCLNYWRNGLEGELGLCWKLADQVQVAVHMWAPGRASGVYTAGIAYLPSATLRLEGEWRKEAGWPLNTRVQCLYRPAAALTLLAGFSAGPATQFAGAAFRVGRLQIGVTGSNHLLLGITPAMTIVWER